MFLIQVEWHGNSSYIAWVSDKSRSTKETPGRWLPGLLSKQLKMENNKSKDNSRQLKMENNKPKDNSRKTLFVFRIAWGGTQENEYKSIRFYLSIGHQALLDSWILQLKQVWGLRRLTGKSNWSTHRVLLVLFRYICQIEICI